MMILKLKIAKTFFISLSMNIYNMTSVSHNLQLCVCVCVYVQAKQ